MINAPAATARDSGLVHAVGPLALTGAFVGILIGGGIFTIPAVMAAAVGSLAPVAYLGAAIAVGLVMLCFAEAASRVPTSGGPYGFVAAAFGPYAGWLTGALNWASPVLTAGGIAAAAADAGSSVFPGLAGGPVRAAALITWFATLAAINIAGVGGAARFVAIMTGIKLIPLAIFIAVGIWFIEPVNLTLPLAPGAADISTQIGRAAILGIFLFTGMEATLAVSGEVREPSRTIPRAIFFSILGYGVLCITVQLVAQGILGPALATSKAPLADAMATIAAPLQLLLVVGAVLSMLGWTASDSLSSPRSLFAFARDGLLPAPLGRLHPRTHAPHVAIITHSAIAAAFAVTGSFATLAVLATLLTLLVYLLGCAAALKLRRDDIALAGNPIRVPALGLVAAAGIAIMLWVAAQSTAAEAIGIAVFIALVTLLYRFRQAPITV